MAEIVVLPLPSSARAEAKRCGVSLQTVLRRRDLPEDALVLGRDGKCYRAHPLTQPQRANRNKLIRMALELGFTHQQIADGLGIGRGTVSNVALTVKRRRRRSRQSRRHWG